MHLFISNDTTAPYATLLPDDSRHCVRVLRMTVGDELWVTSGDGTLCRARLANPHPDSCEVEIVERLTDYQPRPFHLHIAVAPTKNNARLEWFVEKAVEIGVDRITPVICDHSERTTLKTERLDKLALSAMKQSLKATRPIIDQPMKLLDFLKTLNPQSSILNPQRFVCYCSGHERNTLRQLYTPGTDALVLIGPEGDFSDREIATAIQSGFQPVTLGNSRLRTETAALYATTVLNFMNI
ncbi:MAG: 16S rRNA (uracil(1498)-N(3))-methyltransferase [Bacteroidales bacterium]|nr:16S rRNA (uracil(1498)-N(3))-methyltransferase [Bacteroidales bacterium]